MFIVSSPLWFRAPFAVLRLFVREKLRERVSRNIFYFFLNLQCTCVVKIDVSHFIHLSVVGVHC